MWACPPFSPSHSPPAQGLGRGTILHNLCTSPLAAGGGDPQGTVASVPEIEGQGAGQAGGSQPKSQCSLVGATVWESSRKGDRGQ